MQRSGILELRQKATARGGRVFAWDFRNSSKSSAIELFSRDLTLTANGGIVPRAGGVICKGTSQYFSIPAADCLEMNPYGDDYVVELLVRTINSPSNAALWLVDKNEDSNPLVDNHLRIYKEDDVFYHSVYPSDYTPRKATSLANNVDGIIDYHILGIFARTFATAGLHVAVNTLSGGSDSYYDRTDYPWPITSVNPEAGDLGLGVLTGGASTKVVLKWFGLYMFGYNGLYDTYYDSQDQLSRLARALLTDQAKLEEGGRL